MARIIQIRYAGRCADCGSVLEVGASARYYGRGKLYGTQCHTPDGERVDNDEQDYSGHCEDYPCCGHGSGMCASERRAERRAEARRAAKPVKTPQVAETPSDYPMSYNDRAQELMDF